MCMIRSNLFRSDAGCLINEDDGRFALSGHFEQASHLGGGLRAGAESEDW